MGGSDLIIGILIPVAAVLGIGIWYGIIHRSHRRPRKDAPAPLKHTTQGGAFQGSGGRQVSPTRDAVVPESLKYENTDQS
jgi:hypothetical protein